MRRVGGERERGGGGGGGKMREKVVVVYNSRKTRNVNHIRSRESLCRVLERDI